jgi:Xaa-Pro aminopeptidase
MMQPSNWKRLYRILEEKNLSHALVSSPPNVRYISGFTGTDATLLVGQGSKILFTDSRYTQQAKEQATSFRILTYRRKVEEIAEFIRRSGIKRLGYEPDRMTNQLYRSYRKHLKQIKMVPVSAGVESLRARKTGDEIKKIAKACRIAEKSFEKVLPLIRPGAREADIACELEYRMKKAGSGPVAFESIVASGTRAALPHGIASRKRLKKGEMVILDFGASYEGYFSDQTITVSLGKPSRKLKNIYNIVREAQNRGMKAIREGEEICKVDAAARDYISDKGYGKYFGHGLGHGVGLEVHEQPALNYTNRNRLEQGMVVTVEPGIYLPGWGGVRIEDMVVVTKTGCRQLTNSSAPLRII